MQSQKAPKAAVLRAAKRALSTALHKHDIGVTKAVQYVVGKYASLRRCDILELAQDEHLNLGTVNRHFYEVRSGKVSPPKTIH